MYPRKNETGYQITFVIRKGKADSQKFQINFRGMLNKSKNFDSAAAIGYYGRPAEKNFFRLCINGMAVRVENGQ